MREKEREREAAPSVWDGKEELAFPPWAVATVRVIFPDRAYVWNDVAIAHAYLGPEDGGIDPVRLRKWRAAVVADLVRERDTGPIPVATARWWAGVSWLRIVRALFPTPKRDDHELGAGGSHPYGMSRRRRLVCLGVAHLCLLLPETPRLYRRRSKGEGRKRAVATLEVLAMVDPVTGGPPRAPESIARGIYRQRFGTDAPAREKGLPDTHSVPIHPAYAPFVLPLPAQLLDNGKRKRGRPFRTAGAFREPLRPARVSG